MMTKLKDPISALTHMAGAIASIVALVFLIIVSATEGNAYNVVSCTIFGVSLILLYTFSTLYHSLKVGERATRVLRKFDHIMIYVLIAGTYTPICLGPLRGPWGWSIFGVVWGIAVGGIILKSICNNPPRWLSTSLYLLMGWVVIVAVVPMLNTFSLEALLWLLAGGIFYTVGAVIYGLKKPALPFKHFGFHELFHVFVLLGSLCHFYFVITYAIG